jgi:hypothetical protein
MKLTPACNGLVPELLIWQDVYIANQIILSPDNWKCRAVESDNIVLHLTQTQAPWQLF